MAMERHGSRRRSRELIDRPPFGGPAGMLTESEKIFLRPFIRNGENTQYAPMFDGGAGGLGGAALYISWIKYDLAQDDYIQSIPRYPTGLGGQPGFARLACVRFITY